MGKQLTPQEIEAILNSTTTRQRKTDPSEPRTIDNWWKQTNVHFINTTDVKEVSGIEAKCANPRCEDPRKEDRILLLAEVKDTLMCRFCFLDGWLSDA